MCSFTFSINNSFISFIMLLLLQFFNRTATSYRYENNRKASIQMLRVSAKYPDLAVWVVLTGTWFCVAHGASIADIRLDRRTRAKGEIAQVGYSGEAGRWNEIKRGEATRLKGKAGPTPNWTASVGCSRRHLYSREIVIDRSENPNGFVAPFLPFFISCVLPPERRRDRAWTSTSVLPRVSSQYPRALSLWIEIRKRSRHSSVNISVTIDR